MSVKKLLLKLLVLFWSINTFHVYASENMTSKELKDTEIQLGSSVYTKSHIRSHLDLIFDKKEGMDYILRITSPKDGSAIVYFLYDNGYSEISDVFNVYLKEITELTELTELKSINYVEKIKVVGGVEAHIRWLYLNSPIEFYELPNEIFITHWGMLHFQNPSQNIQDYILATSRKLKNESLSYADSSYSTRTEDTTIQDNVEQISLSSTSRYLFAHNVKNIDKFANEMVLKDMIGGFIIHTPKEGEIKETLTNVNANSLSPPNMYTFDKALLKAMYSDDFIYGTPREEALDWLSAEIFQLIKNNRI